MAGRGMRFPIYSGSMEASTGHPMPWGARSSRPWGISRSAARARWGLAGMCAICAICADTWKSRIAPVITVTAPNARA